MFKIHDYHFAFILIGPKEVTSIGRQLNGKSSVARGARAALLQLFLRATVIGKETVAPRSEVSRWPNLLPLQEIHEKHSVSLGLLAMNSLVRCPRFDSWTLEDDQNLDHPRSLAVAKSGSAA